MTYQNQSKSPSIWSVLPILLLASATSIISTDLYSASLPALPSLLNTTPSMVKLTMSLNILVLGLAQLIHGPLSDRLGRRPMLLGGLLVFSLASVGCALAPDIETLLVMRVLQGAAAAVEAVVVLAVIREVFDEEGQVKALAWFGIVIALAPAVAPIAGGYIFELAGWRANFHVMAVAGVLTALLVYLRLPESGTPDPMATRPSRVMRAYRDLMTNRVFVSYVALESICLAAIFAFITAGPFIYIDLLGLRPTAFGYFQAVIVLAFSAGSFLAERIAGRLPPRRILMAGLYISLAGVAWLVSVISMGVSSPWPLTGAMSVILFGAGPVFATTPMLAMKAAGKVIGAAAALIGGTEMLAAGLASGALSFMSSESAMPLLQVFAVLTPLAALAFVASSETSSGKTNENGSRPGGQNQSDR
ncbi:MAG: multidrug effflux MFS transporter [Gammaproteobacteria bacterium]|nr:multidrug effflux MFS transporter [Gammaproteobacteria bacterium]